MNYNFLFKVPASKGHLDEFMVIGNGNQLPTQIVIVHDGDIIVFDEALDDEPKILIDYYIYLDSTHPGHGQGGPIANWNKLGDLALKTQTAWMRSRGFPIAQDVDCAVRQSALTISNKPMGQQVLEEVVILRSEAFLFSEYFVQNKANVVQEIANKMYGKSDE